MATKDIEIVRKIVSILDSVDYSHYSNGTAKTYLEYVSGSWTDERKLIHPIIFRKFVEQILGFKLGENIGTQEAGAEGRDIPDYIPVDIRTHPFVFDCKGMDTDRLSKWFGQIRRYIEGQRGLKYGILTNMRSLEVYVPELGARTEEFNIDFVQLYKDCKAAAPGILEKDNTKHFLDFVANFSYVRLTIEEKFRKILEATNWTEPRILDIGLFTNRLRDIVSRIHADVIKKKEELISLREIDVERARKIAQEVEIIASEIDRGREIRESSTEIFEEIIEAPQHSVSGRALNAFFYRVAYFTMTRLLLVRAWEDIGFIEQSLDDGGLAKWYENFNKQIRRVLIYAFNLAAERYKWLFKIDNNYSWYEPSDDTLIEVLYEFSNFYLGKLDQDVLGTIYEEYIDQVDRKQKGQYYTPREIIELIWNRVGFTNPEAFFSHSEGKRIPKLIFDPATGSGGFLVEAARRVRDESGINWDDFEDLLELRNAILYSIFGGEISIFPYYITEVNLLIQLTPVVKRMIELKKRYREPVALGVIPIDSLSLYNPGAVILPGQEHEFGQIRNLLPLEGQKKTIFQKTKGKYDGEFSYCCSNPPYISEKGHKELFRSTLHNFPYWTDFYQGKMDYFYFFIILGLSKLRNPDGNTPGGKLGFITTSYWPTADGATKLRRHILKNAKIKEIILFEDIKIFEYAKGQNNMVFVLEKCAGEDNEQERKENCVKIVKVLARHQDILGNTIREKLRFLVKHIENHIPKNDWSDRYINVFWSGVKQGELPSDGGAWNELMVQKNSMDFLQKLQEKGKPLNKMCYIDRGVDSSADRVTQKNISLIAEPVLKESDIAPGYGIFLLTDVEKERLELQSSELDLLKPTYKNSDICPYFVDADERLFILYTKKGTKIANYPNVLAHLEKVRDLLESRGGHKKGEKGWFSLHRPRDEKILSSNKIVCPRWGKKGPDCFGFQTGEYYEGTDTWIIVPKDSQKQNIFYILAILNSSLIKAWMAEKAQRRGYTAQSALFEIPIRQIDFNVVEEVQLHNTIVDMVGTIRAKSFELSKYSKFFREQKLTKLEPQEPLPPINPEAIIQAMLSEKQYSVRTHPALKVIKTNPIDEDDFILNKIGNVETTFEGPELKLISKDGHAIFLKGEYELLEIVALAFEGHKNETWTHLKELPIIPETVMEYMNRRQEIINEVVNLRIETKSLQDSIDNIMFKLYGVPIPQAPPAAPPSPSEK